MPYPSCAAEHKLCRGVFPGFTWHHFATGNEYNHREAKPRKEGRLNTPQLSRRQTELPRNSLLLPTFCTPMSSNPGVCEQLCHVLNHRSQDNPRPRLTFFGLPPLLQVSRQQHRTRPAQMLQALLSLVPLGRKALTVSLLPVYIGIQMSHWFYCTESWMVYS